MYHLLRASSMMTAILVALGIKSEEEAETQELVMSIKRAILARTKLDLVECDKLLHESLQEARRLKNDKAISYIINLMADNYFDLSQLEEAEELYKELLRRVLGSGEKAENDNSVIEISLQLAKIYATRKEYEKADAGFQFVHDNQQVKLKQMKLDKRQNLKESLTDDEKNSIALFGMILEERGKYYHKRQMYTEAVTDIRRAFNLSRLVNGDYHHQTIILLNDLGVVLEMR